MVLGLYSFISTSAWDHPHHLLEAGGCGDDGADGCLNLLFWLEYGIGVVLTAMNWICGRG